MDHFAFSGQSRIQADEKTDDGTTQQQADSTGRREAMSQGVVTRYHRASCQAQGKFKVKLFSGLDNPRLRDHQAILEWPTQR
jgi:hypothetical protein